MFSSTSHYLEPVQRTRQRVPRHYRGVRAGEQLMDGPTNPHDMRGPRRAVWVWARWGAVLRVLGEKELQKYLVNEIQEVYRLQGRQHQRQAHRGHLTSDDAVGANRGRRRHRVPDRRADGQVPLRQIGRHYGERALVIQAGGRPATAQPLLLGITKASLSTDSFISGVIGPVPRSLRNVPLRGESARECLRTGAGSGPARTPAPVRASPTGGGGPSAPDAAGSGGAGASASNGRTDGTTHLVVEPLELLERLAALSSGRDRPVCGARLRHRAAIA
jgi:hypothetical protein